jgi:uncharacterized protein (DUF952 family)
MNGESKPTEQMIFKICSAEAWADAQSSGNFTGSTDDQRDGYIHFSTADQVVGTLDRHFAKRAGLILLAVPVAVLGPALKFEASRGGALFPHLYASLSTGSVAWHAPLPLDAAGRHLVPDLAGTRT